MNINLSPEDAQRVLDRGDAGAELLANPSFIRVIDDASHYHLAGLVAAPVGESGREAREYHHTMHTALRDIVSDIQGHVAAAEDIRNRLAIIDEDDFV